MSKTNDSLEALALLRDAEMARLRNVPSVARGEAAKKLFQQLRDLDKKHGLHVIPDDTWNELEVQISGRNKSCRVTYFNEHGIRVTRPYVGDQLAVDLDLDKANECFVGLEIDTYRAPVPGDPPHRRPAIAVLVEKILEALTPAP